MLALSLIGLRDGRDMRKYFAWFFLFAVTIAVGVAAKALAASEQRVVLPVRNLGVTKTLPKARCGRSATIVTVAGSEPPAIRELFLGTRMIGFINTRAWRSARR